eukprot:c4970_g1_i2.p3 GENE.c4970_g1_i2~~c4970_g1_i2.p3  ORF type:complete len:172 (-),score=44.14 c4970_g1_i2:131-646(-)
MFDPDANMWLPLTPMNTPRYGCASALLGDAVVVLGGSDQVKNLESCEMMDPRTGKWMSVSSMKVGLYGLSCCAVNEYSLIATGGAPHNCPDTNVVGLLDIRRPVWQTCSPMHSPRVCHATFRLPDTQYIIACGGKRVPSGAEAIHVETFQTFPLPWSIELWHHGACAVQLF